MAFSPPPAGRRAPLSRSMDLSYAADASVVSSLGDRRLNLGAAAAATRASRDAASSAVLMSLVVGSTFIHEPSSVSIIYLFFIVACNALTHFSLVF